MKFTPHLLVPVKPIRIAVEKYVKENNTNLTDVCMKLDWYKSKKTTAKYADLSRLRVTLGMASYNNHGLHVFRRYMRQKTALHIIDTINRDPWEFDL